jgi:hypothetical protein
MLSSCVPHQGDVNQDLTNVAAFIEADSPDIGIENDFDDKMGVSEEEAGQLDDNCVSQSKSDEYSFPDGIKSTTPNEEHVIEEEDVLSGGNSGRQDWKSFVNQTINNDTIDITIEKIDLSIYSEGYLVGDFFYEKPHVPGKSRAANRINDFFCREYDRFLNGSLMFPDNDDYRRSKDYLEESLGWWDAKELAIQPFTCNVVTKMTFLSEDYISFFQTYRAWSTGPRDTFNYGVTFNMKTGELVPFTAFVGIEANAFKNRLCDTLLPLVDIFSIMPEDVYKMYGPDDDNTFIVTYYNTEVALDKCYFYDGKSIFLTLNYELFPHDGIIIRWDDIMYMPFIINYDDTIYVLEHP